MTTPPLPPDLENWIQRFRGPLVGFLASRCRSWAVAEELAMDTFAEAWLGRDRMHAAADDLDGVGVWLRGIARNLLHAHLRQRQRGPRPLEHEVAAAPTPVADDRLDALHAGFTALRPELQEVLRMHYLESASAREVAALLGVSPKAIENRLYLARRALRESAQRHLRAAQGVRT